MGQEKMFQIRRRRFRKHFVPECPGRIYIFECVTNPDYFLIKMTDILHKCQKVIFVLL